MTDSPLPHDATVARGDTPRPSTAAGGRFAPGAIVAGRYRIIAILGHGGMGEVYRAEDMKLGHPVALKFLPRSLTSDPKTIERLIGEVRLGRQVSHPNVCRIYDLGESEEGHFIAMEYVDGEDLASLLRRIGRLPAQKAIEIARDLSAGLASAHDAGIVHRDLKPANIMIDGRGRARITDFGLAIVESGARGGEIAGTPAYMAPEQMNGDPATIRTDIYSLGLILYEVFTGKSLNMPERRSGKTPGISSIVRDVDPAIERVVMRCLDSDPASRPASAHAIVASLPGGDPLAAALAAGDTPSPAMVAAAGAVGDLHAGVAWAIAVAVIAGTLVVAALSSRTMLLYSIALPKSPEVLAARGQEIAERLGYAEPPVAVSSLWLWDYVALRWMEKHDPSPDRWKTIGHARPGVVHFFFRSSQREMSAGGPEHAIDPFDPPLTEPGMIGAALDPMGRLVEFRAVPPAKDAPAPAAHPDWSAAFREAGIDIGRFRPSAAIWSAPVDVDEKRAWDGAFPEQPKVPIHVEAGAHRGRVAWFSILGPWNEPQPIREPARPPADAIADWVNTLLEGAILIPAAILAIRNLRRGSADRRAAFRVALVCFAAAFLALLLRANYVSSPYRNWVRVEAAIATSLLKATIAWLMYMAIEPYVRRKWPHNMISWSRLTGGAWKNPMVGRDVLLGIGGGLVLVLVWHFAELLPPLIGLPAPPPLTFAISPLASPRHVGFFLLSGVADYIGAGLALVFFMVLVRAVVRNRFLAVAIVTLALSAAFLGGVGDNIWINAAFAIASGAVLVTVMMRWGLLSLIVTAIVWAWLRAVPPTLDTSAWYFGRLSLVFVAIAALAVYGFIVSLGERPMFGAPLFEE